MYPPPEDPDGDIYALPEQLHPTDKFFVCKVKIITRSQSQAEAFAQISKLLHDIGKAEVMDFGYVSTGEFSPRFYPMEVAVSQEFLDLKTAAFNERENDDSPNNGYARDHFRDTYEHEFDALGENPRAGTN